MQDPCPPSPSSSSPPNTSGIPACAYRQTRGTQRRLLGPKETLLGLTAGSWRPTYSTSQNSFMASRPSVPEMLGVPALLRPEGFQVPRRGGASRSLRTQARSPGNIQLRSVRQWERARGSRSKVNGRPRLRRRGRNCEGLARSPGPASRTCALGARRLSEAPEARSRRRFSVCGCFWKLRS